MSLSSQAACPQALAGREKLAGVTSRTGEGRVRLYRGESSHVLLRQRQAARSGGTHDRDALEEFHND